MKSKLSTKMKTHQRIMENVHIPFTTACMSIVLVGFSFLPSFTFCEEKLVPDYVPGLWLVYSTTPKLEVQCRKESMWEYMLHTTEIK